MIMKSGIPFYPLLFVPCRRKRGSIPSRTQWSDGLVDALHSESEFHELVHGVDLPRFGAGQLQVASEVCVEPRDRACRSARLKVDLQTHGRLAVLVLR
jgi:hypothetical protein